MPAPDHIHPRAAVIQAEREQIAERRDAAGIRRHADSQKPPTVGLALSGGGIRSATFCLGVLQELEQRGVRPLIDYLSTVSGGGFIGSWWSALVSRDVAPETPPAATDESRAKALLNKVLPRLIKRTAAATPHPGASRPSAGIPPEREEAAESRLISHLRLHSNYLTPRSGIGSTDTWRAVTVIGRNLVLAWAVLLPFLLVAVLAAQAWFLATAPELLLNLESSRFADAWPLWVGAAGPPLVGALTALSIVVLFGVCWQGPKPRMPHVGGAALVLLVVALITASAGPPDPALRGWVMAGVALGLLSSWWALSVETVWLPFNGAAQDRAAVRNRLLRTQQQFVQWTVFGTALLLVAGLGHVLFRDLGSVLGERVAEAGGFGAVALTLAGAVYTAFKASPTGGADASASGSVNRVQRLIFRLTPPLLMVLLLLGAAAVNQQLLMRASSDQGFFGALVIATLGGVLLCWTYASFEASLADLLRKGHTYTIPAVGAVGLMIGIVLAYATPVLDGNLALWALLAFTLFCLGTLALRFSGRKLTDDEERSLGGGGALSGLPFVVVLAVSVAAGWAGRRAFEGVSAAGDPTRGVALVGAIFTYVVAMATLTVPRGQWKKAAYLLVFALIVSIVLFTFYIDGLGSQPDLLKAFVLFGAATTWVLALGWSTDPNTLSLHSFYRARLVRAYLGASNPQRRAGGTFIEDAVPGDDVRLTELRNVETGAPYHLINATLNLVGNSDLGSSQRMAAPFVFSRKFCGSRDEYVPTDHYVGGELSLGTAVAISGAAASPNMGSQTGSGGLAMLMTLFNVRLGFWAPRPGGGAWASPQPRFWAFYTLREFLSRTTDTASYCFLSDGGHFDNTGIYALVERGCRLIIAADCGADPARTFFDLGTLARRCRIDFGAEMSVAIDNLRKDAEREGLSRAPFTIGRITYSASYLASIGDPDPNETVAYLVLIKPSLLGDEPVDVRQYSFENDAFPQQTTSDQWFDEAQFESYRRLGMHCARVTLDDLLPQARPDDEPIPAEALLAALMQTAADSTETAATPPAAEEIGDLMWAVALNAARVAEVTFAPYTEAIIKSEFRRVAAGMFASGRTRPSIVHSAQLQARQLVGRMAATARRRGARELEEGDWLDAVRSARHLYPFSLGAQERR